jgi:uroporphyrinogen III methyltransferase / synthase
MVAQAMGEFESLDNRRILLLRAEVANPELPKRLEGLGAIVDDVACYRTEGETAGSEKESEQLRTWGADWVTFTSGSTVEHFHNRFDLPELRKKFPQLRIASIGPETSRVLKTLGITPEIEANPHTIEGLVAAIETAVAAAR